MNGLRHDLVIRGGTVMQGVTVPRDGQPTGARPGRALRRGA